MGKVAPHVKKAPYPDDTEVVIVIQGIEDVFHGTACDLETLPLHRTTGVYQDHDILGTRRSLQVPGSNPAVIQVDPTCPVVSRPFRT